MRNREGRVAFVFAIPLLAVTPAVTQQPPPPVDVTPLNGETYYILNQRSGLQVGAGNNSAAGGPIAQQPRSFTNLSQRWAFTSLTGGLWRISNIGNGLCIDSNSDPATRAHACRPFHGRQGEVSGFAPGCAVVQNPCTTVATQQWVLTPAGNGYCTIVNQSTGLAIDLAESSASASAPLVQTRLEGAATQSQQWLLRPAFLRGVDNALLEKQEAARAALNLPWWNDAGQPQDVLQVFKNHGVNLVRLRPSSVPPYADVSDAPCGGDACYGETDAQDLDLAKRAKNLGMSVELTLLFDGASSAGVPSAWAGDTQLAHLQSDLYDYVKGEVLSYRRAGVMPDLVAIGNEVDTGFLGSLGSPTGENFGGFAALQIAGMQAVKDAAADTSVGPAIPPPLTCIHITPAWDPSQFFSLANQFGIPYDAICQSYYPIYHGPLTAAEAAASNPDSKPVEQEVLVNTANNLGKPVFIIETGEHYQNGFASNDPWYSPPSPALQRQFLLDVQSVVRGLPDNLGMGIEYWDPAGVNIPNASGGLINGDNLPDAIYLWNGLTLFDDTDVSVLPGVDALGDKLDPTLRYKFINRSNGEILSVFQASNSAGAPLDTEVNNWNPAWSQQWRITSNSDGYFKIASLNPGLSNTTNVLDDSGGSAARNNAIVQSPSVGSQEQEWDVVSVGNGYFNFVNRLSGLALDRSGGSGAQAAFAVQEALDANRATQQWEIVPVP